MASESLKEYVAQIDEYVEKQPDMQYVDAYYQACKVAFWKEKDKEFGCEVAKKGRDCINAILKAKRGQDIWQFENVCQQYNAEPRELTRYYDFLKEESFYRFESFIYYMERYRSQEKRFYLPRQKTLCTVMSDLEDLANREIKFLGISMPSRTGKLISDDTPVLTEDGWKNHGDLEVGDYVYDFEGQLVKVVYVHPKDYATKRVVFECGESIDCHPNHEWVIYDKQLGIEYVAETKFIENNFYMENGENRFYVPLVGHLKTKIERIEDIEPKSGNCITVVGGIYRVGKRMIPTHNSTICIFYLAWKTLLCPDSHSAMGGHSGILAKGFHLEYYGLLSSEDYTFREIFEYFYPNKKFVLNKSAEELSVTLGKVQRFPTLACRGMDGSWTGIIDVSWDGLLYVDDLIKDREHSLSPTRMEKTFQEYLNKMVDRKSGATPPKELYPDSKFDGATELMVGTLWNVLDPLERMRKLYENDPLYRFRKIPALNENDESNFDYEIGGFTTEYFRDIRERLDDAEWQSKYQQNPYVREGLLYPLDELRYFNGIMPEGDSRVVAVVDVAWGGGDNLSMPIGREYENGDVYIFDWVYSKDPKESTIPLVVGRIIQNEIRQCRFEGNVGGAMYSDYVNEELIKQGFKCSCTEKKAPNNMAKVEKIIAYAGDIKRKFIFLESKKPTVEELERDRANGIKRYYRDSMYQNAMDDLGTFVSIGKNVHDDSPDSLTQLEMFIEDGFSKKVQVIRGLF